MKSFRDWKKYLNGMDKSAGKRNVRTKADKHWVRGLQTVLDKNQGYARNVRLLQADS